MSQQVLIACTPHDTQLACQIARILQENQIQVRIAPHETDTACLAIRCQIYLPLYSHACMYSAWPLSEARQAFYGGAIFLPVCLDAMQPGAEIALYTAQNDPIYPEQFASEADAITHILQCVQSLLIKETAQTSSPPAESNCEDSENSCSQVPAAAHDSNAQPQTMPDCACDLCACYARPRCTGDNPYIRSSTSLRASQAAAF